jgi:polyisoprenoid-binding protein YceI
MKPTALLFILIAVSVPFFSSVAGPPKGKSYLVKKDKSEFKIYVYKAGFASGFAHDHVMGVEKFTGQVNCDPDQPKKSSVFIKIQSPSLKVLDPKVSVSDREKIKKSMDSDEVLDVKKYPTIKFLSSAVKVVKRGKEIQLKVTGTLYLHGKKKKITIPIAITFPKSGQLVAVGKYTLTQTDFGITPYSAYLGAVKVKDKIDIKFKIVNESL